METKFKKVAKFLEALETEAIINENEQALLLIGGQGTAPVTNNGCTNNSCQPNPDRIDSGCTNNGCTNSGC